MPSFEMPGQPTLQPQESPEIKAIPIQKDEYHDTPDEAPENGLEEPVSLTRVISKQIIRDLLRILRISYNPGRNLSTNSRNFRQKSNKTKSAFVFLKSKHKHHLKKSHCLSQCSRSDQKPLHNLKHSYKVFRCKTKTIKKA